MELSVMAVIGISL